MSTATVLSRASAGLHAPSVCVEVHLSNGLPGFTIVGLPESTVRESRERVRSALLTSHFEWPDHRITVSLAPADIPKGGGRFDLPIALGLLVASGQLPASALIGREFFGELGLDGGLRSCRGLLTAVRAATLDDHTCAVPDAQASALARIPNSRILAAPDLLSLCALLKENNPAFCQTEIAPQIEREVPDLASIKGQVAAKRALEIAASGGHHLLMIGPPGAGKTLLAACLPGLLPPLLEEEQLEIMLIRDLLGMEPEARRPFRAPHHTVSPNGLVGGGARPMPGEISLAHRGVLFLDELPEFPQRVLDLLRQPLESGEVNIVRTRESCRYPSAFQLVTAMNPCPCGYAGSADPPCRCSAEVVGRYQSRISGPLLDRMDLYVPLERQHSAVLLNAQDDGESSATVAARVRTCRSIQRQRQDVLNIDLTGEALVAQCALEAPVRHWFEQACDRLRLSARSVHRTLRVARTLADMEGKERVEEHSLLEALGYRPRLGS